MTHYTEQLKVKLKTLGAEVKIIKGQENKIARTISKKGSSMSDATKKKLLETQGSLNGHRKQRWKIYGLVATGRNSLLLESRLSHLAYAFLRGRTYNQVEGSTNTKVEILFYVKSLQEIIIRFCDYKTRALIENVPSTVYDWIIEGDYSYSNRLNNLVRKSLNS